LAVSSNVDKWTSGASYDVWMGRWSRLLAHEFLRWLDAAKNLRWLDVCCGSGILSEAIVQHSSPKSIAGVDLSPGQIAFAREHRSAANITFEVADAMHLPFEAQNFDISVCGLGLNFVPQPEQAIRQMRRVTRSCGTIAAYVWDYAAGARFLREFWDAAAVIDPEASAFDQARRFPMCTERGMRQLFEAAGLQDVNLGAIQTSMRFENFNDYWQPFNSGQGSAPNYLASRNERIRNAIRERLQSTLPFAKDESLTLPARAWAVRGQGLMNTP
jgi:SAM-dependent methyltransferase